MTTATKTVKQNQGGMKHHLSKTKKLKAYRRLLHTLKRRSFKTKSAKLHRQQKIQYLKSRIRKLNQRNHPRKTSKLRQTRTSSAVIVADNYVSPRVFPISSVASPSVISSNAPVIENLPASIPSTITPSSSQGNISIDISPLTASTMNTASIPVSTAQTDSSISTIASVAPIGIPPPQLMNTSPTMPTSPSPVGDSLHLSDLNVSNPPSPTSMDTKTTVETTSV